MFLAGHMPGRYGLAAVRGNVFAARDSNALIRRLANFGCTTYATVSAAVSRTKLRGFLRSAQSSPGHPILQSTTDRALGSQAGPSKPNDCRSGDRQSNPDLHDKVSRREAQVCAVPASVAVLIRPTACATQAGSCQKESRSAMWQKRLSVFAWTRQHPVPEMWRSDATMQHLSFSSFPHPFCHRRPLAVFQSARG